MRYRHKGLIAFAALSLLAGTAYVAGLVDFGGDYTFTRRVVGVPYEKMLAEYVDLLKNVDGITDAEYRNYDPIRKTALVTVTYDPDITTPKVIMVWFGNTMSIWQKSVIA